MSNIPEGTPYIKYIYGRYYVFVVGKGDTASFKSVKKAERHIKKIRDGKAWYSGQVRYYPPTV